MTLPATGLIWFSQIKAEFGGGNNLGGYYRGQGRVTTNPSNGNVSATPGARISLGDFHGARTVVPGSWDQWTPGQYYAIAVPEYQWVRMRAWGGGGSAAHVNIGAGHDGEMSVISGYIGAGGGLGGVYSVEQTPGGEAVGGNVENLPGGPSVKGAGSNYNGGGSSPYGGAGGTPYFDRSVLIGSPGEAPGGGGGGINGSGGSGASFAHSYYENGFALSLDVYVAYGGASLGSRSGAGAPGRVLIEWG